MKTLFLGRDKGNAVLLSIVLIVVFSLTFLSLIPYIGSMKRNSALYKEDVIQSIKQNNEEIIREYDLH